jgi:hypothetical protein
MKRAIALLACVSVVSTLAPACGTNVATIGQGKKLLVTITQGDPGTVDAPLPVSVSQSTPFTVSIQAVQPDGTTDTSFNGYVNVAVQPGSVENLAVTNVQLVNGEIDDVVVPVLGVFGEAHIWATDLGYEPAPPNRIPPPQCADGIDNNDNGLIDYPADPGCYAPVDDTENGGTYAEGVSEAIYFHLPRIQLVRGYDPANNGEGNATAFPNQQISIDTGWRGGTTYAFSTVVIGLTSAGFYVQDLQTDEQPAPGYGGLYAYNFSTPSFMRVCDRVQILSGTSSDFYGFTELNYPAWQLEYWDPNVRLCLVPEAIRVGTADINSQNRMWQLEATLAMALTTGTRSVHVAKHFGPTNVPLVNGVYTPGPGASNCDFDHSGKIDYSDPAESACATVCTGSCSVAPTDYECSEYSQFSSEDNFYLIMDDSSDGTQARITANTAAASGFDPVGASSDAQKYGTTVKALTGLVSYFSGGCQFTLNARCDDDVIYCPHSGPCLQNYTEPLLASNACVHPRSLSSITANQ